MGSSWSAPTTVSKTDKLVLITDRKVENVVFPNVPDAEAERLKSVIKAISPPDKAITISLECIIAQLDASQVMVRPVGHPDYHGFEHSHA